jgi:hypothetical protein
MGLAALGVVLLSACDARPEDRREEARARELEAAGVQRFDSAGAYGLAGVSTRRRIEVEALRPEALGADTLDPAFHLLQMRCGSCHGVPAPGSKPAYLWDAVLSRMKQNIAAAGLLPMSAADEAAVLRFLKDHAADRK